MTYDHRDVGASTRFTDAVAAQSPFRGLIGGGTPAYTAEDMTDDAVAVMDAVGWSSAHVFGLSMGGLLAQRIALRHPDRVRSLATMSAMPSDAGGARQPALPPPGLHPRDQQARLPGHARG